MRSATRQTSSRAASSVDRDVGEQLLHQLVARRSACRTARARWRSRPRRPGRPGRCRRSRPPPTSGPWPAPPSRSLKPLPSLAEPGAVGHPDVVEDQLGGGLAAQAELAVDLARARARGCRSATRKAVMPLWPGLAAGAGEDQRDVGPGAVGDEHLRAGEHPVVAVAHAPGWRGCRRPSRCPAR